MSISKYSFTLVICVILMAPSKSSSSENIHEKEVAQLKEFGLKHRSLGNEFELKVRKTEFVILNSQNGNIIPFTEEYVDLLKNEGKVILPDDSSATESLINFYDQPSLKNILGTLDYQFRTQDKDSVPVVALSKTPSIENKKNQDELIASISSPEAERCKQLIPAITGHLSTMFEERASRDHFKEYKEKCGLKSLKTFKSDYISEIESRLSAIVDEDGRVICSGFLIATNSVITARHCFNSINIKSTTDYKVMINNQQKTITGNIRVENIACNKLQKNNSIFRRLSLQPCDYLLVKLKDTVPIEIDKFPVSDEIDFMDKIIVVGYHSINHSYENSAYGNGLNWINGVVVSDHAMCVIYKTEKIIINESEEKCFSHGCQTIKGMSGAPIFKIINNKAYFTGIQIGTTKFDNTNWLQNANSYCKFIPDMGQDSVVNNLAIKTNLSSI